MSQILLTILKLWNPKRSDPNRPDHQHVLTPTIRKSWCMHCSCSVHSQVAQGREAGKVEKD